MTTIAANRECMAADTRVSDENTGLSYPAAKIFRIRKSLFGTAGHGSICLVMVEWLRTSRNRESLYKQLGPDQRDQIRLLELNPDGLFVWDGWGLPEKVLLDCYAIGSGAKAARALLAKGAEPKDAVDTAGELDFYTAPPVHVEYLKRKRG